MDTLEPRAQSHSHCVHHHAFCFHHRGIFPCDPDHHRYSLCHCTPLCHICFCLPTGLSILDYHFQPTGLTTWYVLSQSFNLHCHCYSTFDCVVVTYRVDKSYEGATTSVKTGPISSSSFLLLIIASPLSQPSTNQNICCSS